MTTSQVLQLVATLLGGGAMGAIITLSVTAWRNRVQGVQRDLTLIRVFRGTLGSSDLQAALVLSDGSSEARFHSLFLLRVVLRNSTNVDFPRFSFGITFEPGDNVIFVSSATPDRHHAVEQRVVAAVAAPLRECDLSLVPFNRGDSYSLQLYLVVPEGAEAPEEPVLSTSHPVRFVDTQRAARTATQVAIAVAKRILPF